MYVKIMFGNYLAFLYRMCDRFHVIEILSIEIGLTCFFSYRHIKIIHIIIRIKQKPNIMSKEYKFGWTFDLSVLMVYC